MAKTLKPRKPKTTRLRPGSAKASTFAKAKVDKSSGSGEASTKTTAPRSPKLPKAIQAVIEAAQDKKATGVVVLDRRKAIAFKDYFVIC